MGCIFTEFTVISKKQNTLGDHFHCITMHCFVGSLVTCLEWLYFSRTAKEIVCKMKLNLPPSKDMKCFSFCQEIASSIFGNGAKEGRG